MLVCWRLDRLGRNLKHLITLLDELQALGIAFVSLAEGIDATTPSKTTRGTRRNIVPQDILRTIDLSEAAMRALDPTLKKGVLGVKVERVPDVQVESFR